MRQSVIACDDCTAQLIIPTVDAAWIVALRADELGWNCSEFGDFCPRHNTSADERIWLPGDVEPPIGTRAYFRHDPRFSWERKTNGWHCARTNCTHCPCDWDEALAWGSPLVEALTVSDEDRAWIAEDSLYERTADAATPYDED